MSPAYRILLTQIMLLFVAGIVFAQADSAPKVIAKYTASSANDLEFSPDGSLIAAAGTNDTTLLAKAAVQEEVRRWEGHDGSAVYAVSFSPDNKLVYSSGRDGRVRQWRTTDGEQTEAVFAQGELGSKSGQSHEYDVYGVVCLPTDVVLSLGGSNDDSALRSWKPDGELVANHEYLPLAAAVGNRVGAMRYLSVSPDGKHIGGGTFSNDVWLISATRPSQLTIVPAEGRPGAEVADLAFSPNGKTLAVANRLGRNTGRAAAGRAAAEPSGFVDLWDSSRARVVGSFSHPAPIQCVAYAPSGDLYYGTEDGQVVHCRRGKKRGTPLLTLDHPIYQLAFSPAGDLLAVGGPELTIWRLSAATATREESPRTAKSKASRLWRTADGRFSVRAVMVDADDKEVRLKKQDGKTVSVPIRILSPADRRYIESNAAKP